ncbi:hypothetical protein [Streptomyces sp. NPDC050485]|uniref:hypothetical protein n=1 Tax=Streptomyces sp. NPDC050485 TaxID=3365617 RepID=UPI0037B72349
MDRREALLSTQCHRGGEGGARYDGELEAYHERVVAAVEHGGGAVGWKAATFGWIGTRFGTMVGVSDRRELPEEHSAVINAAMNEKMRAAVHKVWGEPGLAPVQRGSVALMTQEFRAAVAQTGA